MKNKLVKSMTMIIAIAMLISMVPAVVSAETVDPTVDITNVTISEPDNDGAVTVNVEYTSAGLEEYTLLVVRSTEPYETDENGDADLPSGKLPTDDDVLQKAIEYIDQETAKTSDTISFKLRERTGELVMEGAPYINVLMGGAAASAKVFAARQLEAAPTITTPLTTTVFSDEDIVFGVTGGNAIWADAAEVYVNGADTEDTTARVTADSITLESTVNVTSLEVVSDGYYAAPWSGTITVKDRMEEAEKIAKAVSVSPVYGTAEDAIGAGYAQITIPANVTDEPTTGASIAYTLKDSEGNEVNPDEEGGLVYTVARPEENEPDATYTLEYLITYPDLTDVEGSKQITVNAIGNDGPSFTADDVTILKESGAYGDADKALIKFKKADVTGAASFKVGEADLYWSPQKEAFYGVIAASVITGETDEAKKTAVANALKAGYTANEDSEVLYFGVAVSSGTTLIDEDFFLAMRVYLSTPADTDNITDKINLALDVANADEDVHELDGDVIDVDFFAMMNAYLTGAAYPVLGN